MKKLKQAAIQAVYALESALGYAITQDADWNAKDIEAVESTITNLREALEQHKPHEECECNACLNYFTDKAHEEALAEQAEQESVAWLWVSEHGSERLEWEPVEDTSKWKSTPLYAAPVRTKDLTDDEIAQAVGSPLDEVYMADFRAVIAADREKNK